MRKALVLAVLVLLSGCAGAFGPLQDATDTVTPPEGGPGDPDTDVKGWEAGVWYNESLDVDASDGLDDAELDHVVSRAMARVEKLRSVEFDEDVPVEVIERGSFGNSGNDRDVPPAKRAFDNVKMESLLLIGEDENSLAVQQRNREVSVGGFYSSGRDEIVVITDGEGASIDETTLGHELMHAWQDQRFDLSSISADTRDGHNANNGLVEGDANFVQHQYRERCDTDWECVLPDENGDGGGGQLANYGVYALKFFPYSDGPRFVQSLKRTGGWAAVNDAYEDLPASSEQVALPERYGRDPPTNVRLSDQLSGSWTRVNPPNRANYGTVGQAGVTAMFVYPLYHSQGQTAIIPAESFFNRNEDGELDRFDPLNYSHPYAAGWDGDRLHVYQNDAGEKGYVWRLVWDSAEDAREFADGYRQTLRYWGGESHGDGLYVVPNGSFADAFHLSVSGQTVTIVNAPTAAQLDEVRGSLEVSTDGVPEPVNPPTPDRQTGGGETATPTAFAIPGFDPVTTVLALTALLAVVVLAGRRRSQR